MQPYDRHSVQFETNQSISASEAVRKFSALRKQARHQPVIILDKNKPDSVILSYETYEALYNLVQNIEERTSIIHTNKDKPNAIPEKKQTFHSSQLLSEEELQFLGIKILNKDT